MARTRLSPQERREQLLDLGSRLFADRSYDEVWIEEVAEEAGVSRGLLYHYFPNKKAFFLAMLQREAERLRALTETAEDVDPVTRLTVGVDAYLAYCRDHQHGIRMIYNGSDSADPDVQAIIEADIEIQSGRITAALSPDHEPHLLLRIAVRSWLAYLRYAARAWLDEPEISQDEIRDLCVTTLVASVVALPEHARPQFVPATGSTT